MMTRMMTRTATRCGPLFLSRRDGAHRCTLAITGLASGQAFGGFKIFDFLEIFLSFEPIFWFVNG